MAEIRKRMNNTASEIEYAEIYFPDDKNLGNGEFKTVLNPNSLSKGKQISSIMLNKPVFQISVNINPNADEVFVLLGKADGTNPTTNNKYALPTEINAQNSHEINVGFIDWQITKLEFDEKNLLEK